MHHAEEEPPSCLDKCDPFCDCLERTFVCMKSNRLCWGTIRAFLASGRLLFKLLGLFCAVVAISLITSLSYLYFHVALPLYYDMGSFSGKLHFMFVLCLSLFIVFL